MRAPLKSALVATLLIGLSACGGSDGGGGGSSTPTAPTAPTTPTTPTIPTPPANKVPVISNVAVTPVFGVAQLTTFTYSASASDPDNDPVTYQWDLLGTARTGSSGTIIFPGDANGSVRVTVTDGKGGSATDSRSVTVGSMAGRWTGSGVILGDFSMQLTQTGPVVTGSITNVLGTGNTPSDLPGSIDSLGVLQIRLKQAPFIDYTFKGQMDQSGRRVTGTIHGSGFNGQAFYMDK